MRKDPREALRTKEPPLPTASDETGTSVLEPRGT